MPELMDASQAKNLLGIDDATLQNYINNGTIRATRVDGQLMLSAEDVQNLMANVGSDSDDGTIILSGESDDLQIDLGEVVDENAQTMVQPGGPDSQATESITFGDELEVVNFDEGGTEELEFDQTDATTGLSFTDSNTAAVTDVDETVVATGTATSDFQTVDYGETDEQAATVGSTAGRRSVRSQRVRQEAPKTHWIWPTVLILTMLIVAFFAVPYPIMSVVPQDDKHYNGDQMRGSMDNMWTDIASAWAGFSVEPDPEAFKRNHPPEDQWISIRQVGDPDMWRYKQRLGTLDPQERLEHTIIDKVESQTAPDGTQQPTSAQSLDDQGQVLETYPVTSTTLADGTRSFKPVMKYP